MVGFIRLPLNAFLAAAVSRTFAALTVTLLVGVSVTSVLAQGNTLTSPMHVAMSFGSAHIYSEFETLTATQHIISKEQLPEIRSQYQTPTCQSFCVTALVEFEKCRQEGRKVCYSLSASERISPVSMFMYRDNLRKSDIASIHTLVDMDEGSGLINKILGKISSSIDEPTFFSESCFPFDRFIAQQGFPSVDQIRAFYREMEHQFDSARSGVGITETDYQSCKACSQLLQTVRSSYFVDPDPLEFLGSLRSDNFRKFLFKLTFDRDFNRSAECQEINMRHVQFINYPSFGDPKIPLVALIDKVKANLVDQKPIILSGLCVSKHIVTGKCSFHCVLLVGIKSMRKRTTGEIVEFIQVRNSWGKDWQAQNNDGWIMLSALKELLQTADDPNIEKRPEQRLHVFSHTISWIK